MRQIEKTLSSSSAQGIPRVLGTDEPISAGKAKVLLRAVDLIGDLLNADTVVLRCYSRLPETELYSFGSNAEQIAGSRTVSDLMSAATSPILIEDATESVVLRDHPLTRPPSVLGGLMLTPIYSSARKRLAELLVVSARPNRFSGTVLPQLQVLSDMIRDELERMATSAVAAGAESEDDAALYRIAFDAVAEVVMFFGADGRMTTCNRGAEVYYGATRDVLVGTHYQKPLQVYFDESNLPVPSDQLPSARAVRERRPVRNVTLGSRSADGERKWHSVSAEPVFGPNQSLRSVVVTARNITEEKSVADRLSNAAENMRRASVALNAIAEGVRIYDIEGRFVQSNPSAVRLMDSQETVSIGDHYREATKHFRRSDGSPFPETELPVYRALYEGKTSSGVEACVCLPNGRDVWLSINASPIKDAVTGSVQFAVVTFRDVTSERRAVAQQQEALTLARKASQAKSDFLAIMSHELRTPMNAVLGAAQLLERGALEPEQKRMLQLLQQSGQQMLVLLSDLLEVAALEGDRVKIEPTVSRLDEVVQDVALIWEKQVAARGLKFVWTCEPECELPRLFDAVRLRQILGNLLSNALKFTSRGVIEIKADVIADDAEGGLARITVRDTGEGIPEEDLERIFEPFEQLDASTRRRQGGMGIGLQVARKMARAMQGDLVVESERGVGSTFALCLPAPRTTPEEWRTSDLAVAQGPREILCVDDNPRNLLVITRLLEAAGHSVTACESGHAALAAAAGYRFDLVLLDMVMPEMDGLEVLARLRASPGPNQATPVVACTANVLPEQLETYMSAGVESVVAKPIDLRDLLEAVHRSTHAARLA